MASKVLPQALFITPRSSNQWPPKKLGLSTFPSPRSSSLNLNRLSTSRFSSNSFAFHFRPIVVSPKRFFIVRAEADNEGELGADENTEEEETVSETESEVKLDAEDEAKPPRKPRVKLGDIMGILNKRAIEASEKERPVPDLRTGDIVEIKLEVPENRRRLSIYKGIVISKQNAGIHTTIRVRRIIAGVGVEIVFPVYSPNIKEIKVVNHRKVRRARLYYLRDKLPRLSTFK
ncbi:50S ribosomal protein L19-2, chloroplastic-like [Vitis riparia]|uniref:50S ribosomal protein L19, chloroplastic n=2 Tax=Vitis vinifera TaxID=29760 RepID=D7U6T6_VITVI|eukprot:XP_002264869.2 PREDICTED: 50S ribosomal protein L19-2, chloroplastic [Vitis vinifera]